MEKIIVISKHLSLKEAQKATYVSKGDNGLPVILSPDDYESWLNCAEYAGKDVIHLLAKDQIELDCYPVSKFVNSPAHDGAECIQPLG